MREVTDQEVDVAIAAFSAKATEGAPETARWPDDYDEKERAACRECMRAALAAMPGMREMVVTDAMIDAAMAQLTMHPDLAEADRLAVRAALRAALAAMPGEDTVWNAALDAAAELLKQHDGPMAAGLLRNLRRPA